MERLTKYDNSAKCYLPFSLVNWDEIKIMTKLGELEDVLEEFELTSAKDLRTCLKFSKTNMIIWEGKIELKNKIADLEQELVELKQKAIVPKFNIGAILYMIPTQFNGLTKIKDYKLLSIGLSDIGVRYDMAVNKKESGIEPFYCASEDMFGKSIFATQEEAEQKLAEIKGEKDE